MVSLSEETRLITFRGVEGATAVVDTVEDGVSELELTEEGSEAAADAVGELVADFREGAAKRSSDIGEEGAAAEASGESSEGTRAQASSKEMSGYTAS